MFYFQKYANSCSLYVKYMYIFSKITVIHIKYYLTFYYYHLKATWPLVSKLIYILFTKNHLQSIFYSLNMYIKFTYIQLYMRYTIQIYVFWFLLEFSYIFYMTVTKEVFRKVYHYWYFDLLCNILYHYTISKRE